MQSTDLRELKRLFDALRQSGHQQYKTQLGYLHALLQRTPRLRGLLESLKAATAGFDADTWIQERIVEGKRSCHEWPDEETAKLRVLLRIIERAVGPEMHPVGVGAHLAYNNNLDDQAQVFTKNVVFPIIDYLQTRIGTDSEILFRLERMRRRIEWFEQQTLYAAYQADTRNGEEIYDRRTREILFAEGIDYPFSQPASASGRVDIVAGLETDDPLVCEVKLYDGGSYGPSYLRRGVGQAVRYARDYGKHVGHLVVFNLSDERLQLPNDDGAARPARLHLEGGVTVFMIVVQAKQPPTASKDRQRTVRTIDREQLVPMASDLGAESETAPADIVGSGDAS